MLTTVVQLLGKITFFTTNQNISNLKQRFTQNASSFHYTSTIFVSLKRNGLLLKVQQCEHCITNLGLEG